MSNSVITNNVRLSGHRVYHISITIYSPTRGIKLGLVELKIVLTYNYWSIVLIDVVLPKHCYRVYKYFLAYNKI